MPAYTIEQVTGQREWAGKDGGTFVSYKLVLKDVGPAELTQKPSTPAPTVGQVVEGTLEPPKNPAFPPKLRKAQQGGGGFRGKSPEDQRMIVHQHSQTAAIQFFAAKNPALLTLENVRRLARELTDDVTAVARDVPPPPKAVRDFPPPERAHTDVPADADGLGGDTRTEDEKAHDEAIPF